MDRKNHMLFSVSSASSLSSSSLSESCSLTRKGAVKTGSCCSTVSCITCSSNDDAESHRINSDDGSTSESLHDEEHGNGSTEDNGIDNKGGTKWPSELLRLINEPTTVDWTAVIERLHYYPHEAILEVDDEGMNALHAACYRYASPSVIRAILDVAPMTASHSRKTGELPLHVACYTSTEEVQDAILRAYPDAAAVQDTYGDCPLHYAIRHGASPSILEQLLDAAPQAIGFQNAQGDTPFSELNKSYLSAESFQEILEDEENGFYRQDWDSMALILRASYLSLGLSDKLERQPPGMLDVSCGDWIVHAAAATSSCPKAVLRCLCRLFPEQSRRPDSHGMTPLLLAVKAENFVSTKTDQPGQQEWDQSPEADEDFEDPSEFGGELEDDIDMTTSKSAVSILLDWDRVAAKIPDPDGQLPLAHALITGKSWDDVVYPLFSAHPVAVESLSKTGLPMFTLAAQHSPSLDTIFGIICMDPNFHGAIKDMQYAAASREELQQRLDVPFREGNGRRRRLR